MKNENRNKERKKMRVKKRSERQTRSQDNQQTNVQLLLTMSVLRLTAKQTGNSVSNENQPNRMKMKIKRNAATGEKKYIHKTKEQTKNCSKIKQTNRRLFITLCITRNPF